MMKIDTKNPYAEKPKKIDNEFCDWQFNTTDAATLDSSKL